LYLRRETKHSKIAFKRLFLFSQNFCKKTFVFLLFEAPRCFFFYKNRELSEHSSPLVRLLYKKNHLLKVIRIILPIYGQPFWTLLSKKQQFLLLKNLINLTRKKGTYIYINSFLNETIDLSSIKEGYILIDLSFIKEKKRDYGYFLIENAQQRLYFQEIP
jgi:hypothetical protein